ncbi:transmembrane protein 150A-like [Myxocyprinus asiaticus]|uniref:transmembrane protein 150A-like n=1 Tax=Myxocyprinus asiaticus TaxID=70543 RepID=UPI00222226F8|nr:transmembrane protein 150A-like [Myxocyprinus asiaticus]
MGFWVILPIILCSVSFVGCWTVYGLALRFNHVCSLSNWEYRNSCHTNETGMCCTLDNVPTISTSGANFPENSLFTATINAGSFLFLIFCIFHHAHILDQSSMHSLLSKIALVLGCVASMGAFMAGNCNPVELLLLHYLGAALSFVCVCLYITILTSLTSKCMLTGCEWLLYPLRILSATIQISATILYCIFFIQEDSFYKHISAVFEWMLSLNLELYELSYVVEFYFFSSSMLSALLAKKEEEKPLILT